MSPIRLLIADDHTLVRQGFCALMNSVPGIEVVGQAADGNEAVQRALELQPDVILMDLLMPRKDGLQAIREIIHKLPGARILVITSFVEDEKVLESIEAGALGYLMKDSTADELLQAVRAAHQGEAHLHPSLARKLVRRINRTPDHSQAAPTTPDSLTKREMSILQFIVQGLSNKDIAGRLYLSERTVDAHVSKILKKLHLANRTQAAMYALQKGLANDAPILPM